MPNFNQFIKGFDEEPKQPEQEQPKPEEVETEKPKVEESEFSKSRPAFTHDFAESLRKDAINWANEKLPHDKSLPKILNNYTRDEVIDFMRGNIGEDEIMKRAKERNGINQDRVNLLAKQEVAKHEIKPQPKSGPRFQRAKQPQQGSFRDIEKSFDEPEQKQFSKEEIALADKTADYLDNYLGFDGFEVRKLPNGNYLTNVHLGDPDVEPEEVGPEVMLAKYKELIEGGVDPKEIA